MLSHGFARSLYYSCVNLKNTSAEFLIYLVLDVDDMLVTCSSLFEVEALKKQLLNDFDMKHLRSVKQILCMKIVRNGSNGFLYFNQKRYIEMVLLRLSMTEQIVYLTQMMLLVLCIL